MATYTRDPNTEVTADPHVFIEKRGITGGVPWIRYQRIADGRRWEVHGTCVRQGDCMVGAIIQNPFYAIRTSLTEEQKTQLLAEQEIVQVPSISWLRSVDTIVSPTRLGSDYDTPVTPEFTGCCPFTYVELTPMRPDR